MFSLSADEWSGFQYRSQELRRALGLRATAVWTTGLRRRERMQPTCSALNKSPVFAPDQPVIRCPVHEHDDERHRIADRHAVDSDLFRPARRRSESERPRWYDRRHEHILSSRAATARDTQAGNRLCAHCCDVADAAERVRMRRWQSACETP